MLYTIRAFALGRFVSATDTESWASVCGHLQHLAEGDCDFVTVTRTMGAESVRILTYNTGGQHGKS